VRVLVPYAAAGPADILARLPAQKLSEQLGMQFYVENVGGGGGNIGMGQGARAPADGYTVLVVPPNIVVNPAMYDTVPYDPYKDFDPVTVAVSAPTVLGTSLAPSSEREGAHSADQIRWRQVQLRVGWFAFIVPAGTPKEITALLNREIIKLIALPEIKEQLASLGFTAVGMTPEQSAALFRTESVRWAKVIREAGIKAN
jgi:tripartite-type tricarboxylate transporter receptor subunit TctC